MVNYLSLLGWSLSADQDIFGRDELVKNFDVADVLGNPARFDEKKLIAINAEHIRMLDKDNFAQRLRAYLEEYKGFPANYPDDKFAVAAELVQTRIKTLGDAWDLLKFLVVSDEDFEIDEKSGRKNLKEDAVQALDVAMEELDAIDESSFTTERIEAALHGALIDRLGLKPRKAFGAIRVATSGAAVSPPLFESLELLGKQTTMKRLKDARAVTPWSAQQ